MQEESIGKVAKSSINSHAEERDSIQPKGK